MKWPRFSKNDDAAGPGGGDDPVLYSGDSKHAATYHPEVRVYGDDKTIHRNESLDVEVDDKGNVVSVWFRCQMLPFKQSNVEPDRAREMRDAYEEHGAPRIANVGVIDVR